jgi:hypothetical protein
VSEEQISQVKKLVNEGSVVWTDTDFAQACGFECLEAPAQREGTAVIREMDHPVVKGLSNVNISYGLCPTALIARIAPPLPKGLVPLVYVPPGGGAADSIAVVVAIKKDGRGMFVLLPTKIHIAGSEDAGKQKEPIVSERDGGDTVARRFMDNLREFSQKVSAGEADAILK